MGERDYVLGALRRAGDGRAEAQQAKRLTLDDASKMFARDGWQVGAADQEVDAVAK